ncbi:hypothetical protein B0I35DRAFT_413755 [Stachybotrys elegans]|uniref:non-specific serine/threonine protein kinase n=1 Tax=Stachybotrys elegans TaxID=80388 RepID=A0A8K0SFB8_9HYPO|nr:hypothetical protein B0I35DRAFT_413755 [Stachybotrys elegans]
MPPLPAGHGQRSTTTLLALALVLLPWLQFADAQQQHTRHSPPGSGPNYIPRQQQQQIRRSDGAARDALDDAWLSTHDAVEAAQATHPRSQQRPRGSSRDSDLVQNIIIPDDASALATLAPDSSVRAPASRGLRFNSAPVSGLASPPHHARNLKDWEVEDFVLLATVDGDLYATDRRTGVERWRLEVDHPMVETTHYRVNNSVLDDDYSPLDHYIWAVEPIRDGGLYVWSPDPGAGVVKTPFTMKSLVEEHSPYADEYPPVVYTGDKKTTMVTLDAATGRVLKWFGSSGSHINQPDSCLQPNAIYGNDECSSIGTITLGRTEYTVAIQRRDDGTPVATLKYSEWGPNHFDNDLYAQYHTSLDKQYITSRHDGKIYAFDQGHPQNNDPLFTHKFPTPVARVFDVCRPWDAPPNSNPELVILPQPTMPSRDAAVNRMRSSSIFLNTTEDGSWYAMSGRAYPLIIDAPEATLSRRNGGGKGLAWDTVSEPRLHKGLVGIHFLDQEAVREKPGTQLALPTEPANKAKDLDEEHDLPILPPTEGLQPHEPTIITGLKMLPQSAANSVVDFVSNPVWLLIFCITIIWNEKKLRRAYNRYRTGGSFKQALEFYVNDSPSDSLTDEIHSHDTDKAKEALGQHVVRPEDAPVKAPGEKASASDENSSTSEGGAGSSEEVAKVAESTSPSQAQTEAAATDATPDNADAAPPVKKKAHRGRRGGVKHRKGRQRETSVSRDDEPVPATVEDAVLKAKKLGDNPMLEPDIVTVTNDVQAVSGPIVRMGNIEVDMNDQLGIGSNGTLVFAGKFDGRDVAVKRMLIQFYDIASQETKLLRESDDHPNVIRYYSQQSRDGFLYIALEKCAASLADIVARPHSFPALAEAGRRDLPNVLYQIANGLDHLHNLRIVHRDLKPQNILVNMGKDGRPRLMVSDFGLCKKLETNQSSFGATTGRAAGTTGWQAPELLLDDKADASGMTQESHPGESEMSSGSMLGDGTMSGGRRKTKAIDVFSLGLVFFYVLSGGEHPFDCGDKFMREVNIRKGKYELKLLDSLGDFAYEAKDLISSMLHADPEQRPMTRAILSHPFFWSPKKRLAFLCDVSDHFEKEMRDPPSEALMTLEDQAPEVIPTDFLRILPREFVDSLGKQRKYKGNKLLDLLRALRNKRNHYEDMPDSLKRSVGPLPEGYLSFWTVRFPSLLITCWCIVRWVGWDTEPRFIEYYEPAGL